MDFGSTMLARVHIENRTQALLQQDIAAEQSTMAYRAPELFDVKTGQTIDEKVDIWVRLSRCFLLYILSNLYSTGIVIRLYPLRSRLFPLAFREYSNDRAGRVNSHGRFKCSIQAPAVSVFTRTQKLNRRHVESESCRPPRHQSGLQQPPPSSLLLLAD